MLALLALAGCAVSESLPDGAGGVLRQGTSEIGLSRGFSKVRAYRGETVRLVLRAKGALSLSALMRVFRVAVV